MCTTTSSLPSHDALLMIFFFNDTATTEIYTLSLHDALPISNRISTVHILTAAINRLHRWHRPLETQHTDRPRSEEHTSELQSRQYLVCRLLLEKKKATSLIGGELVDIDFCLRASSSGWTWPS